MSVDKKFGITYYPKHIYRILRGKNNKGGASIISAKQFENEILGWVYTKILMDYYDLLPDERLSSVLVTEDKTLPEELVDISWKIKKYLDAHGPFSPLAIGLMNCIIDMDKMGIKDSKTYFKLQEHLDINPADSFSDYVKIITKFEKELKEC